MGKFIDMTNWVMKEHDIPDSKITVLYKNTKIYHPVEWWCKCECGKIFSVRGTEIRSGRTKSCGCLQKEKAAQIGHNNQINLVNKTFGYLTVLYDSGKRRNRQTIWHCKCVCGNEKDVSEDDLKQGKTTSCGCRKYSLGEENIKNILDKNNISYKYNSAYFQDLYGLNNCLLRYDFIIFNNNNEPIRLIEFDGIQHFQSVPLFGGEENFKNIQQRDGIKNQYALSHKIPLVRIPYTKRDKISLDLLMSDEFLVK